MHSFLFVSFQCNRFNSLILKRAPTVQPSKTHKFNGSAEFGLVVLLFVDYYLTHLQLAGSSRSCICFEFRFQFGIEVYICLEDLYCGSLSVQLMPLFIWSPQILCKRVVQTFATLNTVFLSLAFASSLSLDTEWITFICCVLCYKVQSRNENEFCCLRIN